MRTHQAADADLDAHSPARMAKPLARSIDVCRSAVTAMPPDQRSDEIIDADAGLRVEPCRTRLGVRPARLALEGHLR